jgi:hypothetical protein
MPRYRIPTFTVSEDVENHFAVDWPIYKVRLETGKFARFTRREHAEIYCEARNAGKKHRTAMQVVYAKG